MSPRKRKSYSREFELEAVRLITEKEYSIAEASRNLGNLRSRVKKKFKATTDSRHNFPVAANLLNQNFATNTPDTTRVGDMTYIPTQEGWLYLAVLIDLYNRQVVGWATSSR